MVPLREAWQRAECGFVNDRGVDMELKLAAMDEKESQTAFVFKFEHEGIRIREPTRQTIRPYPSGIRLVVVDIDVIQGNAAGHRQPNPGRRIEEGIWTNGVQVSHSSREFRNVIDVRQVERGAADISIQGPRLVVGARLRLPQRRSFLIVASVELGIAFRTEGVRNSSNLALDLGTAGARPGGFRAGLEMRARAPIARQSPGRSRWPC